MTKNWPRQTNRELLYLLEINDVMTNNEAIGLKCDRLFAKLACSMKSLHYLVSERALLLLHNPRIVSAFKSCSSQHKVVVRALVHTLKKHWHPSVLGVAMLTFKKLIDLFGDFYIQTKM